MYRTILVGSGNMGRGVAAAAVARPEFVIVGCADLDLARAELVGAEFGVPGFSSLEEAHSKTKPDVVIVATQNRTHAELTLDAIQLGVKAVYCEKPISVSLGEAKSVLEASRASGTVVVSNHQRRLLDEMQTMRRLITEGAIGDVYLARGSCGGDVLSDGTHLIDSLRYLIGDPVAKRVFAQVYRKAPNPDEPRSEGFQPSGGYRYGHPVETGAIATVLFESGVRLELFTGSELLPGRFYQDYEVFGSKGTIWRKWDGETVRLHIRTDSNEFAPVVVEPSGIANPIEKSFALLAEILTTGGTHPLDVVSAYANQEIITAIYESGRLRAPVEFPVTQMEFPLLIEEREVKK